MQSIFWFRRDLRLIDNAGLYHALKADFPVQCIFIFDSTILNQLEDKKDARVEFIHLQILRLQKELNELGSNLLVFYGKPIEVFQELLETNTIHTIYSNKDYEPKAILRDLEIEAISKKQKISFYNFKDQVIFEEKEVLKDDGKPYTVYTPYSKKWKIKLKDFYLKSYPTEKYFQNFRQIETKEILTLEDLGFAKTEIDFPSKVPNLEIISTYDVTRNFPAIKGTTRLSLHLRFGTISIRKLGRIGLQNNETYLNELIWRDFYMMILANFPHVENKCFKAKYEGIPWRNNEEEFEKWCQGKTGFPLIDAGMRELNQTGFMHNRVRMVVASFLVKDLLIDWRWGEAYFANKLLDFDLSANNGGWQWAAGCGCDAAPYFRIFSPDSQQKKFDPDLKYIKKWIPEFEDPFQYPNPMLDRKISRERALTTYKETLNKYEKK